MDRMKALKLFGWKLDTLENRLAMAKQGIITKDEAIEKGYSGGRPPMNERFQRDWMPVLTTCAPETLHHKPHVLCDIWSKKIKNS